MSKIGNILNVLNNKFERVTKQIENLQISREIFIELEISESKSYDRKIYSIEDRIYDLDDLQYEIQRSIEELENA